MAATPPRIRANDRLPGVPIARRAGSGRADDRGVFIHGRIEKLRISDISDWRIVDATRSASHDLRDASRRRVSPHR
jgi:hypothetical protein